MAVSEGIMTARGGMTSHAAVVARGMGTCCVAGVNGIKVSEEDKTITFADGTVCQGRRRYFARRLDRQRLSGRYRDAGS